MTIAAYRDHPIRAKIRAILELSGDSLFSTAEIEGSEVNAFARDKIFSLARLLEDLLQSTPAQLVSLRGLDNIDAQLAPVLSELSNFQAAKNPVHLLNASTHLEQQVLPLLWVFPSFREDQVGTVVSQMLEDFSKRATASIGLLSEQHTAVEEKIAKSTLEASTLEGQLAQMLEAAARERAEASAAVAKLEQMFAQQETERSTVFDKAVGEFKEAYDKLERDTRQQTILLIEELQSQKEKAAKIVQVVGEIGVTGGYQKTAEQEARQANTWRRITIALFSIGIAVAVATFARHYNDPISVENLGTIAIRLLYAVAITSPAWYTAKESARHRTSADRARQMELELASLGPFIELLPEEKKYEITERMTKVFFGRDVEAHRVVTPFDPRSSPADALAPPK